MPDPDQESAIIPGQYDHRGLPVRVMGYGAPPCWKLVNNRWEAHPMGPNGECPEPDMIDITDPRNSPHKAPRDSHSPLSIGELPATPATAG